MVMSSTSDRVLHTQNNKQGLENVQTPLSVLCVGLVCPLHPDVNRNVKNNFSL